MFFRLSYKLTLVLLLSATTSMILLGGIYHQKSQTTIESLVGSHLSLVAKQVKIQVDRYISAQRDRIHLINSRTQLRISLKNFLKQRDISDNRARMIRILNDAQRSLSDITALRIYDNEYNLIVSTAPVHEAESEFSQKRPTLNEIQVIKRSNTTRLQIAAPLKLEREDLGTIVMELDASGLEQSLYSESAQLPPERSIIYYSDIPTGYSPILNYQNISYNNLGFSELIESLIKRPAQTVFHLTQSGKQYLAYNKSLNDGKWGVLLVIDTEIAFRPVNEQNSFLIYSVVFILTLLIVLSLLVGNHISKPIVNMAYVAKLICDGDFSKRIQAYSNDEIGMLGTTLNEMAEKLIMANKELDKKVKEKTLDLKLANEQLLKLNQEITEQSKTDPLTRIKNRKAMNDYLDSETKRANRDKLPLSVLLIDVDHFKRFNDSMGHQKGDDCLIKVAQSLDACAKRDSDMVARYGGEEFCIILPNTDQEAALAISKQILLEMEVLNLPHPASDTSNHVTVSIGVATGQYMKGNPLVGESLIEQADQALYKAKESGRNQAIHCNQLRPKVDNA